MKFFPLIFFLVITSCHSKKMMRTLNDAKKLEINQKQFIGKPLKALLEQIKPQIKMVSVRESSAETPGAIIFKFVDSEEIKKYNKQGKYPLGITVFLKEPFYFDAKNKPKGKKLSWTEEDTKKYGNLTVTGIRVFGNN